MIDPDSKAYKLIKRISYGQLLPLFDPLYHNNKPDSDIAEVVRCTLRVINGRWKTVSPTGAKRTARGIHVFVVQNGRIIINKPKAVAGRKEPLGHVDLARGRPIEFGGEIFFRTSYSKRGSILLWNDETGHYFDTSRPMDPRAVQQLPQDLFRRSKFGA